MLNAACIAVASATPYDLAEYATNKDGTYSDHTYDPNSNFASFSFALNFSGAGQHNAIGFVDPEISQDDNTWYNEYGASHGSLAAGQSWEIDEPGIIYGDIVDNGIGNGNNVQSGTLDNTNSVPITAPDDVSMALGWDFTLNVGETATAQFFLTSALPSNFNGFYLTQTDPDSNLILYYYSTLTIQNGQTPEPPTLALLGIALVGMLAARRKPSKR